MEAFSDGVFAIAITLLVLEISIPAASQGDLLGAVLARWPSYLAYLVSFASVGAIWLAHNAVTEHLESADGTFLRLNLLVLLLVSFLPFPTKLLAENLSTEDAEWVAVTVYGLNLLLAAVAVSALWQCAHRAGLVVASATDEDIRFLTRRLAPGLVGYLAIIALGILLPFVAVIGYLVIALFFLVPVRSLRVARKAIESQWSATRRQPELAARAGRAGEAAVERHQRGVQRLRQGHVPRVVRGQVLAQLPDAFRVRLVGEQLYRQLAEVDVRQRGTVGGQVPGERGAPQDVGDLDGH